MDNKTIALCEQIAATLALPLEAVLAIAEGLLSDGIKITAKNVMREVY